MNHSGSQSGTTSSFIPSTNQLGVHSSEANFDSSSSVFIPSGAHDPADESRARSGTDASVIPSVYQGTAMQAHRGDSEGTSIPSESDAVATSDSHTNGGIFIPSTQHNSVHGSQGQQGYSKNTIILPSGDDPRGISQASASRRGSNGTLIPSVNPDVTLAARGQTASGDPEPGTPRQVEAPRDLPAPRRGSTKGTLIPSFHEGGVRESRAQSGTATPRQQVEQELGDMAEEVEDMPPTDTFSPPIPEQLKPAPPKIDNFKVPSLVKKLTEDPEHNAVGMPKPVGAPKSKKIWGTVSAGGYLWGGSTMRVDWGRTGAAPSAPGVNDEEKAKKPPKLPTKTLTLDLSAVEDPSDTPRRKSGRLSRMFASPRSARSQKSARQNSAATPRATPRGSGVFRKIIRKASVLSPRSGRSARQQSTSQIASPRAELMDDSDAPPMLDSSRMSSQSFEVLASARRQKQFDSGMFPQQVALDTPAESEQDLPKIEFTRVDVGPPTSRHEPSPPIEREVPSGQNKKCAIM
eukprot:c18379_g1_i1.p1 GENE.c18379_g1_i1~~c18379_g1_i1.p1  ORF type:complete len:538 (-),score=62.03 c18379_g1_i1:28-1584(-)